MRGLTRAREGGRIFQVMKGKKEAAVVGVAGFEPAAPASRRRCSTRLSYTPTTGGHSPLRGPAQRAMQPEVAQCALDLAIAQWTSRIWIARNRLQPLQWRTLAAIATPSRDGLRDFGAWPSGKAAGFGPAIPGSNPGAPATLISAIAKSATRNRRQAISQTRPLTLYRAERCIRAPTDARQTDAAPPPPRSRRCGFPERAL